MIHTKFLKSTIGVLLVLLSIAGCTAPAPRSLPTATSMPPTVTLERPSATSVPPTATAIPPTATPVPPTATPKLPTAMPVLPTATLIPPRATPVLGTGIVRGSIKEGGVKSLVLIPEIDGSFRFSISKDTPQAKSDKSGRFEFTGVRPGLYLLASDDPGGGAFQFLGAPSIESLIVKRLMMSNGPWVFEVKPGQTVELGELAAVLKMN